MATDLSSNLSVVVRITSGEEKYVQQIVEEYLQQYFSHAEYIFCITTKSLKIANYLTGFSKKRHCILLQMAAGVDLAYTYKMGAEASSKESILLIPNEFIHINSGFPQEILTLLAKRISFATRIQGSNFDECLLISRSLLEKVSFRLRHPAYPSPMPFIETFLQKIPSHQRTTIRNSWQDLSRTGVLKQEESVDIPTALTQVKGAPSTQIVASRNTPRSYVNLQVSTPSKLETINIFVLSYERPQTTLLSVESMIKYIKIPKQIFICDNCSCKATQKILKDFSSKHREVKLYINNTNLWIKGLERAINENLTDYFVITDNDIILREYPGDVINHMYSLMRKYRLGAIGLNIFDQDEAYGAKPLKRAPDVIYTSLLDTTFQLMRKDIYRGFNGKVQFHKKHMSIRKFRCGWTCSPYYAEHVWFEKEKEKVESGDKEYLYYLSEKLKHLEETTPTSYDHVRQFIKDKEIPAKPEDPKEDICISITIPTCKTKEQVQPLLDEAVKNLSGDYRYNPFSSCLKDSASVNRNYCINNAQGDIIIMFDDDIKGFYPGWEKDLISPFLKFPGKFSIISARLITETGDMAGQLGDGIEPYLSEKDFQIAYHTAKTKLNLVGSSCIAFPTDVGVRFDEAFLGAGYEDTDFCMQVNQKHPNKKTIINNRCKMIHLSESKGRTVGGKDTIGANRGLFRKKWRISV